MAGWGLATPHTATAVTVNPNVDLACTLNGNLVFNPPLTTLGPADETITVTGDASSCVDNVNRGGNVIQSGTLTGTFTGPLNCVNGSAAGTLSFTWFRVNGSTGTSNVNGTAAGGIIGGNLAFVGTVVSGTDLVGDMETAPISATINQAIINACNSNGLPEDSFLGAAAFT
ncbi:hypothetical protein AB0O00_33245, partial [Kitasatospora sp. NPDC093558]